MNRAMMVVLPYAGRIIRDVQIDDEDLLRKGRITLHHRLASLGDNVHTEPRSQRGGTE